MSRDVCVAHSRVAMRLSAVCDCGISWSYSLITSLSESLLDKIVLWLACHVVTEEVPYK